VAADGGLEAEQIVGGVELAPGLYLLVTAGMSGQQRAIGLEVLRRVAPPDAGWEPRGQIVLPMAQLDPAKLDAASELLQRAIAQAERLCEAPERSR
jgi:hypothetical protein